MEWGTHRSQFFLTFNSSTSTLSNFGPVVNPWSTPEQLRVAGGSSGGSAAAISARVGYA
jgi:Asp-tRNA(Asn)/Glu-tRNA(Gln) amidotransferase A subunit family amidase